MTTDESVGESTKLYPYGCVETINLINGVIEERHSGKQDLKLQ